MRKLATLALCGWLVLSGASMILAQDLITRKVVEVPKVDPAEITIDGKLDEAAWSGAGHADLITSTGYEIWTNKYYREALTEPDYDEFYGRLLWAKDTLYAFIRIDEIVNDSTNLFWAGQWTGDQLFVGLTNRFGVDLAGNYDGNVYTAPDGPYHFLIMGDQLTLNAGSETYIPEEYRCNFADSLAVFDPATIARMAAVIDTVNGVWDVELAIYHPNVDAQGSVGFNIGGSTGSRQSQEQNGDAYAYYCWQPNVPDDPYAIPPVDETDPGSHTLKTSVAWAMLNFVALISDVKTAEPGGIPSGFALTQNYPNPFNPSTSIRFELAKSGPVTLKVYNTLGQLVTTLIDAKPYTAGRYSVSWNAAGLPSGVYLYKLEAGGVVQTQRMTLLR